MVRDVFIKWLRYLKANWNWAECLFKKQKISQKGKSNDILHLRQSKQLLIKKSHLIKYLLAYSTSRSCIKEGEKTVRCYEGKKEKESKREQIRMHAERISVPWLFCPAASRKKKKN